MRLASSVTHAESGVTAAQFFVLSQLDDSPAQSLNELAERTMTDRTSVAPIVEHLAERRLVTATGDAADRRRRVISITAAGRRLLRRAPRPPAAILIDALAELPEATLVALDHGLRQLVRAMGLEEQSAVLLFDDARG